jgi:hypothetical protein
MRESRSNVSAGLLLFRSRAGGPEVDDGVFAYSEDDGALVLADELDLN